MQARQITLNLVPGGVMPRIHCSQYDKGVPVEVTLYDGDSTYSVPADATVYVQGSKLDGTLYQYECTYSGSVVYFDLTIQMTVIAGENTAELSIYDSNEDIVGTCNFVIDVEDSALQDPSESSYNDIPVIADLPGLVRTAEEAAQTAVDAADEVELDMDEIREAVSKSSTSAQLASGYAVDSENYYLLSKSYAVGDASRVGSSVDNAMFYMNEAKEAAEDTAEDVQTIEELMEDLEEIENRTKGYSDSAALSKTSVDTLYSQTVIAKTSADYFATLAESWAHGQTGIRVDESVDNAMYWANKAQAVAKTTVDSAFSTSSVNPVENQVITNQHVNLTINRQDGVHGLRFYNDELDYYDGEKWVEIKTGGGSTFVTIPTAAEQTYTYNGTEQTFVFSDIDLTYITVTNDKQTSAGTYTVTCTLKDEDYVWSDLSTAPKTFSWTINKRQISIPVADSVSYTYDGTQQNFAFSSIDSNNVTVSGDKQTNAGSYTVSCALNDTTNNEWTDTTTTAKEYAWTIAKANSSISISPASVTLDADNLTVTLVPTTTGDGTVSYSGYDTDIITIAGNVVTATQATGNTTITATISATTNYNSASTTVAVTASFAPALVPWSTGSDEEITAMIQAYYAGSISLVDIMGDDNNPGVWAVGDVRSVSLSAMGNEYPSGTQIVGEIHRAQTVELQILDFAHDDLVTAQGGKTKALISLDTKNCLRDASVTDTTGSANTENGYLNSSDTNVGGWDSVSRRTWCNEIAYESLPSYIKDNVKEVKKYTSKGNSESEIITSNDKVFYLSEVEYTGTAPNSYSGEGTQYALYANSSSNLIKLPRWSSTRTSDAYWKRSPSKNSSSSFGYVTPDLNHSQGSPIQTYGISFALCM